MRLGLSFVLHTLHRLSCMQRSTYHFNVIVHKMLTGEIRVPAGGAPRYPSKGIHTLTHSPIKMIYERAQ